MALIVPRLLSDNGSSYVASDLADWLDEHGMDHMSVVRLTIR